MDVRLVALGPEHIDATFAWLSDPEIAENLGLRAQATRERTEEFILGAQNSDVVAAFAIVADEKHVGNVVLDSIDRHLGKARLHIYLGAEGVRGHGVGKRALRLVLAHAFEKMGLHKVWLTVHAQNSLAIAAYRAEGFVVEGTLRDEFLLRGERLDALCMGILRREFGRSVER